MFVFNFRRFGDNLIIDETAAENLPPESPIILYYTEAGNLTNHEILKRFYNILREAKYDWMRPLNLLTGEWLIDLKQLKHTFERLNNSKYLKGKITVDSEYIQDTVFDLESGRDKIKSTSAKFSIYPKDISSISQVYDIEIESELIDSIKRFKKDFPNPEKCCFLMMKFEDSNIQTDIVKLLKKEFTKKGLHLLRADHKAYSDDLFLNIKTYMHCCSFGIALFERINSNYFNPNVSLEIGYMMALKKPILFLKEKTLDSLHSDLIGKLYYNFDYQNIKKTIPQTLEKWLKDKDIIT